MVTANIIQRIFCINFKGNIGTAFVADIGDREYILTAQHILHGIEEEDLIEIEMDKKWQKFNSKHIGTFGDIAALTIDYKFNLKHLRCELSSSGLCYGQDVYFFGYPYNIKGNTITAWGAHLPFVKKAVMSCLDKDIFYLDGHNNPGFSGGPVVFNPDNKTDVVKIAGVISGYKSEPKPIRGGEEKGLFSEHNTGIIIAYKIDPIVDIIKSTSLMRK